MGLFFFTEQPISHHVIAVEPAASIANRFAYQRSEDEWTIDFRTVGIARQMYDKLEQLDRTRLGSFFKLFRSYPQSSALAAWILEPIAHRILRAGTRHQLPLVKMHGNVAVDAPILRVDFGTDIAEERPRLPQGVRDLLAFHAAGLTDLRDDAYYIPVQSTYPLFDSFLVERQPETTDVELVQLILWVFQISTSSEHGGSREGYVSVRKIISSLKSSFGADAAHDKKTINITVKYVYVTPWEEEHTQYEWHCPGGWHQNVIEHDHRGEFYSLRILIPTGTRKSAPLPLPPHHKAKVKRKRDGEDDKGEGPSKKAKM